MPESDERLLHLAQAAERGKPWLLEWDYTVSTWCVAEAGCYTDDKALAEYVAACSPSVVVALIERLTAAEAENHQLELQASVQRGYVEDLDRALTDELANRDAYHEWADQLAYAIAPQSVIGEHSSHNNPWANALEIAVGRGVTGLQEPTKADER